MNCRILYGLLPTVVVLMLSAVSCSLGRLIHEETAYENARIYLKDGTVISGKAVIPDIADKKVRFAPENGRKEKFDASETERLVLWKDKHPDNKTVFFYKDFTNYDEKGKKGPFWMFVLGEGPHLTICMCGAYYSFDKDGNMEALSHPGEDIHIVSFKEDGNAKTIGYHSYSLTSMRNSLMKWLSDDPGLCRKLSDREIKGKDWEEICREYSPRQELPSSRFQYNTSFASMNIGNMNVKTIMIIFLLLMSAGALAQDRVSYLQMYAGLDYEYLPDTYSHNGTAIEFGFDYNFHKNIYASVLAHYGDYNAKKSVIPSDARKEWAVVAGPGFNIIGNGMDRIYAGIYAGYGAAEARRNRYTGEGQTTEISDLSGSFAGAARIGYEHAFGNGFLLGGNVTAWYIGEKLNVAAGITLGLRFR